MVKAGEQADWGLTYGLLYLKKLCVFLLPVLPFQIFTTVAANSRLLDDKNLFLVEVLSYLLNAWLLMGLTIFTICKLRGEVVTIKHIWLQALKTMPKVGLSYVVLMSFVVLSIQIPPGLLLLVYLVWAPIICALEQCAVEEDVDNSERRMDMEPRPRVLDEELEVKLTYFQRKSIFDLGLVRSARFAGINFRDSIFYIIIVWAINVIPIGLFSLFYPVGAGGVSELFILVFVSILEVGVLSGAVLSLVLLMPKDAQAELGFKEPPNLKRLFPDRDKPLFRLSGSRNKLAIICVIALFCTVLILNSLANQRQYPDTAIAEMKYAQIDGDDFKVAVVIEDLEENFRWFDKNNFLITLASADINSFDSETPKEVMAPLAPYKVKILDSEGQRVFDSDSLLDKERLSVHLTYSLGGARMLLEEKPTELGQKKSTKKYKASESGRFNLTFHAMKGGVKHVAEGRYPRGILVSDESRN